MSSSAVTTVMKDSRSPQEMVALRDVVYVVCFGHFPKEDKASTPGHSEDCTDTQTNQQTTATFDPTPIDTTDISLASEHSNFSDQNPFSDDMNPFNEDQNPFTNDDQSSCAEDLNPFNEDEDPEPVVEHNTSSEHQIAVNKSSKSSTVSQKSHSSDQSLSKPKTSTRTPSPVSDLPITPEKNYTDIQTHAIPATPPESPQPPSPSLKSSPIRTPSPVVSSKSPPLPTPPVTGSSSKTLDVNSVSRDHVKEVVAEAFNLTSLDLRRLVEETENDKEAPKVELLLEEIHTEGLALEPTTGSPAPPVVFVRAVVGGEGHFTSFTSTSATKVTQNALTLNVSNVYTQTLLLEVWRAGCSVVEESQSGPVLDFLGHIITSRIRNKKDKADCATAGPSATDESVTTTTTTTEKNKEESPSRDAAVDRNQKDKKQNDEVDHSDETPIINVSLWENQNQRGRSESLQDTPKTAIQKMSPKIVQTKTKDQVNKTGNVKEHKESNEKISDGNNLEEKLPNGDEIDWEEINYQSVDVSDAVSVTSELSSENMKTSTPRGRSASFQSLELSNIKDSKKSEKNKLRKGSLRISASSFRASIRSSFKKGNQNNSVDPKSLRKGSPDNHSLKSENSDVSTSANPFGEEEGVVKTNPLKDGNDYHQELSQVDGHNKLDRERSKSSLSIASLSEKMNLSFRFSSQRASDLFKRIGSKKGKHSYSETSTPELSRQHPPDDDTSVLRFQTEALPEDACNTSDITLAANHSKEVADGPPVAATHLRKSFRTKFTPRTLRAFRSLRDRGYTKKQDNSSEACFAEESKGSSEVLQNPVEIQNYLSGLGKGHLKAELLAHVSVPLKNLVGTWKKEGWLSLIVNQDENSGYGQKKKKFRRAGKSDTVLATKARMACKIHIRLTIPAPESELVTSGYDTYSATLCKLINMQVQALGTLQNYKGAVGAVGDVLLQQLVFFSRVAESHRTLAKWLVLVEVKPSDPGLLLPLLRAIRTHLEAGLYHTTQKRQLSGALSFWVRKVLSDEFEMLHSSFPSNSDLIELSRLENFLRCFSTVENCYELRVMFEREMAPQGMAVITDLLQGALGKHVETWVEALNKEKLQRGSETSLNPSQASPAWLEWQEAQRRASLLTKPILNFLTISFHTYQPIFMVEMSVDYLYLVMPKMLTAALHLLNPLMIYDVDGANQVPVEATPAAAQAGWILCTNLSQINKIGIDSRLPQHLIPQEYRDAFSRTILHWLALSKHLALEEFHRDIQQDEFVAIDDLEGYSQSAVGVADLLKALMMRVCDIKWPGGVGPGGNTLTKISQQIVELAAEYTDKVTHAYAKREEDTDRISKEVCVVVRNVEHVCDEVRKHLLRLAKMAQAEKEVAQQLEERTKHLQEHIDYAAEFLLLRCLPNLEQILTLGVSRGSSEFVLKALEQAIQPVEDRLYFAEPLLHQMWFRLFQHATNLMSNYVQGDLRDDLRRLRTVLDKMHSFLTDQEGVGLHLPDEVDKEYESLQAELKILGATSPELVSQFYHERYQEQCREGSNAAHTIIINSAFTEGGLRVHVVQGPGIQSGGSLVKVRVEPHEWFPTAEPCKTRLSKANPAVFNEIFKIPSVLEDHIEGEQGGVLTLQVRTPRILGNSIVHYEAVLPLALLPHVQETDVLTVQHSRLPLTRPWKLNCKSPYYS